MNITRFLLAEPRVDVMLHITPAERHALRLLAMGTPQAFCSDGSGESDGSHCDCAEAWIGRQVRWLESRALGIARVISDITGEVGPASIMLSIAMNTPPSFTA